MRKKNNKIVFVALNKSNNNVQVSTNKASIAGFLGVHYTTIYRQLLNCPIYSNNEYTIWKNIPIQKIERKCNFKRREY